MKALKALSLYTAIAVFLSPGLLAAKKNVPPPVPLTETGEKYNAQYTEELTRLEGEIKKALPKIDEAKASEFLKAYQTEAAAEANELKCLRAAKRKKDGDPAKIAHNKAIEEVALAATNAVAPSKAMMAELKDFLAADKLDGILGKYFILSHATPRGLAEYAQQGKEQQKRLERLFKDDDLMFQMAVADGARGGKYGKAMEVYESLLKASKKIEKDPVLQRLALGTALEHAMPVGQRPPEAQKDAPRVVDPIKRYLHFEKAYLDGELDPGFKTMRAWDFRNVVNGDETEEILTWGRKMLRNYRPDHITTLNDSWRYVAVVKTDVQYGSQFNKFDDPELQFFQNILRNGGICGRRAFFGRFILRAFGIPATPYRTPGHGALAHWTPKGWASCLAAAWKWGNTVYGEGLAFDEYGRGRVTGEPFEQVRRAQIIGRLLGEERKIGFHAGPSGFWNGVAMYTQRRISAEAEAAVALAAVGVDIAEGNVSNEKEDIQKVAIAEEEKNVVVDKDGTITLAAVACTFDTNTYARRIVFMDSNLGGKQMHYNRVVKRTPHVDFSYTFEAPKAGKYALTSRVVTPSPDQVVLIKVNGAEEPVIVSMPYTIGMWGESEPVEVTLKQGKNVFVCSRGNDNVRGLTIKDFTLKPKF